MKLFQYKSITFLYIKNYHKLSIAKYMFSHAATFFFISYYLYYLSLEKCLLGQYKCSKKVRWIYKKLIQAFFSSFIIAILFEFMLLKIITKKHLIHVFVFRIIFYIYSHGQEYHDHGFFNFVGHIIIVVTITIFILPFNILLYLIKKKNKNLIFIYLSFLIFIFFFYIFVIHSNLNCKDWHKGLNNTYIKNDLKMYGCQIKFPKFCPYKIGTYFLDITKIYKIKCGKDSSGKKKTLKFSNSKYINKNTMRFGYPLTNKDSICLNYSEKINNIYLYTKNNLIDMDNMRILNKKKTNTPEIIVDFSKNKFGELIINVNYNKSLSKERKKLEKYIKPFSENILILYFDSVSRSNGLRHLNDEPFFNESE